MKLRKPGHYSVIYTLESILRSIVGRMFVRVDIIVLEAPTQTSLASHSWAARALTMSANKAEIRVRLAGAEDIQRFERFDDFRGRKAARALERFKASHLCFIAERNRKIVCYAWVAFHEKHIDVIERKIRLDPRSAYGYNEYTDPEYRGMGIFPAVLVTTSNYLSKNGIKQKYAIAYSHNVSAI